MRIEEVTTTKEFVYFGRKLEEGTKFKVPSELDEATAFGWVQGKLADAKFASDELPKKKGPVSTRVVKPEENRALPPVKKKEGDDESDD